MSARLSQQPLMADDDEPMEVAEEPKEESGDDGGALRNSCSTPCSMRRAILLAHLQHSRACPAAQGGSKPRKISRACAPQPAA